MPTDDSFTSLFTAPAAHQTYLVVAADTNIEAGPGAWHSVQTVLASASNGFDACEIARDALEEGFEPHAAFTRAELLSLVEALTHHPLAPGEAYNRDYEKSGAKMIAQRE